MTHDSKFARGNVGIKPAITHICCKYSVIAHWKSIFKNSFTPNYICIKCVFPCATNYLEFDKTSCSIINSNSHTHIVFISHNIHGNWSVFLSRLNNCEFEFSGVLIVVLITKISYIQTVTSVRQ